MWCSHLSPRRSSNVAVRQPSPRQIVPRRRRDANPRVGPRRPLHRGAEPGYAEAVAADPVAEPVPRSLVWATELDVLPPERLVERRGGYLVVRSPGNPRHYWGN